MIEIGLTREEIELVKQYGYGEKKFIFTCVEQGLKRLRKEKLSESSTQAQEKTDVKVQEASPVSQVKEEVKTEVKADVK